MSSEFFLFHRKEVNELNKCRVGKRHKNSRLWAVALGLLALFAFSICALALAQENSNETAQVRIAEDLIQAGRDLFRRQSFEGAAEAYQKAIGAAGSNKTLLAEAWQGKGEAFLVLSGSEKSPRKREAANESLEKALDYFNQVLEIYPENAGAWLNKSFILRWLGRTGEALDAADRAVELNPENIDFLWQRAELLSMLGRYNESDQAFDETIKMIPANSSRKLAEVWTFKGLNFMGQNNYEEALKAFEKVTELDTQEPAGWLCKGDILKALGRQAEAEEVYANAQKLGYSIEPETPQVPPVVVNVTSLGDDDSIELANNESLPREFNNLTMIVDGDENNSIALPNFTMQPGQKMRIHFGQGESNQTDLYLWSKIDLDDAAGNLTLKDSISGIERGYMEYWTPPIQENTTGYWIKKAIELRYRGSFEESAQAYDQALQLDPENAILWIGKALDLSTIGRDNDSIKAYETALQLTEEALKNDPQNAMAWHRKGKILSNLGREDEASSAHETALAAAGQILEKDAENSSVLRIMAEALASLGQCDESLQALDKVIEINPMDYDAMGRKSEILVMMGLFNESLQALGQAIDTSQRYPGAFSVLVGQVRGPAKRKSSG